MYVSLHEGQTLTVRSDIDRHKIHHCKGLFYRDRRNLSFPGLIHQYGRCFLKDGSWGLSNGFTHYLNCCLFCPPPTPPGLHSRSCVKHLRSIFKTKRSSHWRCIFGSRTHREPCIVSKLLSIHHLISAPIHSPKRAQPARVHSFEPKLWISFMVFFHSWDGYWELIGYQAHLSASVSSLSLFSFLFSVDAASLSGPPHMLCVTSCKANNSPHLPWKAQWSLS